MSIVIDVRSAEGITMVQVVVIIIGAFACAAAAGWWLVGRGQVNRDADRFAAARAMTSRWAEDPTSAPKPVLEIARQRTEPVAASEPSQAPAEA